MQPVWQLTGNAAAFEVEGSLRLRLHAGHKTYEEPRQMGDDMKFILAPDEVPDPLLVLAPVDIFTAVDIFPNGGPCLVVNAAFLAAFDQELRESKCREYGVKVVMAGDYRLLNMNREELLARARPDVFLYAIVPGIEIGTELPTQTPDRSVLSVPASEQLPPFFAVPWSVGSLFVRDDIKRRIDESGLRGAMWNLAPWP